MSSIGSLPTPSLLVDLARFDANVARMRSRIAQAGGPCCVRT
jgi:D-serine deaminase-like pyridoxal phosphate-dependent protein